jgi:hypothetical protein
LWPGSLTPATTEAKRQNRLTKLNPMKRTIKIETTPRLQLSRTGRRTPSLLTRLRRYAQHCGQVPSLVGCLALSPIARAVVPPPDGAYAGGNTAEGQNALLSLTTGTYNTALGLFSLRSNTEGNFNTAIGAGALLADTGSRNTATGAGALLSNTSGEGNTANGTFALFSNTTGENNTANGAFSLFSSTEASGNTADGNHALFSNTTGTQNTAIGLQALLNNTTGEANTANGALALSSNTTGSANTANGYQALNRNTTGVENTANGNSALFSNTEGDFNTATGSLALASNLSGSENTATGISALALNVDGNENTATGVSALAVNSNGSGNTANGSRALFNNSTGNSNTAAGSQALDNNFDGNDNTAIGYQALFNNTTGVGNTAIGYQALFNSTTGIVNTALGIQAGTGVTTANGVICIGSNGQNVSNSCFIGNIRGVTTAQPDAIPVVIDSLGQLGTQSSSRRFKNEIQPMGKASEAILAFNPVTFHYKSDQSGTPQFGLIAEEVAGVNPDLVVRDKNGEIYTVRYDAVNAMLLNEFLKEHRKVKQQQNDIEKHEATIAELKSTVAKQERRLHSKLAEQTAQIEALASGVQKVTAQFTAASVSRGGVVRRRRWPELPRQ